MTYYLDTHTAIVGASGAGKTVTAKGHVEALLGYARHLCVLDPTGAWWGLRSSADGGSPGFDIPILGGAHGDAEITADQGETVGSIIASGVSAIVDISGLRTGAEQRRFTRDLLRCLRGKPDGNFHLIVDEADEFAAQKPRDDYGFQVGEELIWMAKRGRLAGFVLTLITQRPASIDKEVLTQAQTLIIHQLVAPVDQKPVIDYLRDNADKATVTEVRSSLASLARGERWLYSPRNGVLERAFSPPIATFDSSRTPEPGERAEEPRMLASIDLAEIRKALEPIDPKQKYPEPTYIDGSHAQHRLDHQAALITQLEAEVAHYRAALKASGHKLLVQQTAIDRAKAMMRDAIGILPEIDELADTPELTGEEPGTTETTKRLRVTPTQRGRADTSEQVTGRQVGMPPQGLNAAARKMVDMLDRIAPARVTWAALAAMVGNKPRGGNFNAARKAMRESGLIVEEHDGVRSAKVGTSGMSRAEAIDLWKSVLSNPAPRMIEALAADSGGLTKADLGAALSIVPRGGNFNNGVAQLLRNGVVVDRGGLLVLADPLPGEGA